MINPWIVLVLICLATHRVTHLLAQDEFPPIADARAWVLDRWGEHSWQAYLSVCSWCMSVYVAAGVVGATILVGASVPLPVLVAATASTVTGLLAAID